MRARITITTVMLALVAGTAIKISLSGKMVGCMSVFAIMAVALLLITLSRYQNKKGIWA